MKMTIQFIHLPFLKVEIFHGKRYKGSLGSQISGNMDRWANRGGKSQRRERKKKEDQRREKKTEDPGAQKYPCVVRPSTRSQGFPPENGLNP